MPNPDALWQDIQKLDDMYEELMWHPDDELQFTHDGKKIIIYNKTCLLYTSPSPRDLSTSRMPSSA